MKENDVATEADLRDFLEAIGATDEDVPEDFIDCMREAITKDHARAEPIRQAENVIEMVRRK